MSLRDDFIAAKNAASRNDVPWELQSVSAAFIEFAHELPARIASAIRRLQGGVSIYSADPNLSVTAIGEQHIYDLNKRVFQLLDKLPGYRQLVIAASDPAIDVALQVRVSQGYDKSGRYAATYTATIDPSRPFSESIAAYGANQYSDQKTLAIGRNPPDWVQHAIKPKLSLPRSAQ